MLAFRNTEMKFLSNINAIYGAMDI